jgi:VWFA-related protein
VSRPLSAVALLLAFTSIIDPRSPQQAPQTPTFRSRTDLVTVEVSVTSGRVPVPGLVLQDFEVADNGIPQRVEMLDTEALPIDLTIVLDTSGSMQRLIEDVKNDAQAIAGMLRPTDRLRLITFAGDVSEAFGFQPPSANLALSRLAAAGATSLYDAVAAAMMRVRDGERRHLIVVLTDGVDTFSVLGREALNDISRRTDAVLYAAVAVPAMGPLVPPPPSAAPPQPLNTRRRWVPLLSRPGDDTPLREAVENTGGVWESMVTIARAPAGVKRALEWFRSAYVLRYRASGVAVAGWHELRVTVSRPGSYDVRARKGYFGR